MSVLDIAPLRSLVAVADCGGVQRAATHLHLSQGAVSQHLRRLEAAVGCTLTERHGRGSRFTDDGEQLLSQARQILALHDETLQGFRPAGEETVTVGCTEHAAAQLLPALSAALTLAAPGYRFRFRIDRGPRLREGLGAGRVDLALLFSDEHASAVSVGELAPAWYSAPTWAPPARPHPVSLVAFDSPCALRNLALETLSARAIPVAIGAEATNLAGVQAAVGAGLGVALMATLGQTPEGLVERHDLPPPAPLELFVCSRRGLPRRVVSLAAETVRPLLRWQVPHDPALVAAS